MSASPPRRRTTERHLGLGGRIVVAVLFAMGLAWASIDPFTVLFFLSYSLVGLVLVLRRPENRVSWVVLAIGFGFLTTTTWPGLDILALERGTAPGWQVFLVWLAGWSGYMNFVPYLALTILFPSGHLPAGRWRLPAIGALTAALGLVVVPAFRTPITATIGATTTVTIENPIGALQTTPVLEALPVLNVILLALGVGVMLRRYRRSTGLARLQLRWLVATLAFVAVGLLVAFATIAIAGDQVGDLVWAPLLVAYPAVPIAIAVAILRYRLYAIDRIISRTVSWAAVTAIVVVGFVFVLFALQTLLVGVVQGEALAVALSTLAAFALLQPVRARVQAVVDRRFDRARIDTQRTVERFGERLREEVDLEAIGAELARTVDVTLRPHQIGVWVRRRGRP